MDVYQRIGEMLVRRGVLTEAQLEEALRVREKKRKRLGEIVVELGFATEEQIAACLGAQFGYEVVDPTDLVPEPSALDMLGPEFALSHRVLPVRNTDELFECIVADPIDVATTDLISRLARKRLVLRIGPATRLVSAIRRVYEIEETPEAEAESDAEPAGVRAASTKPKAGSRARGPKPQLDRMALLEIVGAEVQPRKRVSLRLAVFGEDSRSA